MDAFSCYCKCFYKYDRTLFRLIGHDFFLANFKPGLHAFAVYFMLGFAIFNITYTIFYYDIFNKLNASMFLMQGLVVNLQINNLYLSRDYL